MILISPATLHFILANANEDPASLLLRKNISPEVDLKFAVQQIEGRQRAREKLPELTICTYFIFPPKLHLEQCSSEATARYKARLFEGLAVADITGGLGVDSLYISRSAKSVMYVERNAKLRELARQNFSALGAKNITTYCADGIRFLQTTPRRLNAIYLDPARRDGSQNKVVRLSDCEPNVLECQAELLKKAKTFILKASPMLDIAQALRELSEVAEVHVVAVKNECKELIFVCREGSPHTTCHCVDIQQKRLVRFEFAMAEKNFAPTQYTAQLKRYMYEPNVSILKAGAFSLVGTRFGLEKLHPHTHLYTSDELKSEFPGRILEVQEVFSLSEKELKKRLDSMQANVVARNFPLSVAEIRKRYRLQDGGSVFLYATTLHDGKKRLVKAQKVALNS